MERISVVIDRELLEEVDRAARRAAVSRSALISEALREYLKQLHLEERAANKRRAHRD
jgi:metal-responsive CopG/Arc/MetJ family transcriptional regulator